MRFLHTVLCKSRSHRTCYFEAEMKKERRHTPWELMEMTIEVMQQSVGCGTSFSPLTRSADNGNDACQG